MRVFVNAASAHMGGAVTYLQNVLRWLPEMASSSDTFIVYMPKATAAQLASLSRSCVEVRPYPYESTQGMRRLYFDQVELPRTLRGGGDVLFSTTGFGTLWSPVPQVLLIRNMAYFDPQFHAQYRALGRSLTKNTLRRWHSLLSVRRSEVVLFPTKAIETAVGRYLRTAIGPTETLHYGFDRDGFFEGGTAEPDIVRDIRRWKAEGARVLLSVSTYAVHKNFETLIEALPALRRNGPVRLVTTTSRERTTDKAEYDALQERARELGVDDCWVEPGYVAYEQLQHLYRAADAYVFPSFTESFGHSLVEAMASGLPVVAAGTPVNREVCGEAGRYFDTFDPADCARAIERVLTDDDQRRQMEQVSIERARHFSWKQYTAQLVDLFRQMARCA